MIQKMKVGVLVTKIAPMFNCSLQNRLKYLKLCNYKFISCLFDIMAISDLGKVKRKMQKVV